MLARHISPLKGAGGMLIPPFARHISPFEGSPRASAAEYVLGGMLVKGGMLQPDKLN